MVENFENITGNTDDVAVDFFCNNLRPQSWSEYIGQGAVKENLVIAIEAAKKRTEVLDHILIAGPPGLGKTTLANLIAAEMGSNLKSTSGPAIEKTGDLASILSNLEEGDILFIDEIHRIPRQVEEVLYPAMEDYYLDLVVGKGTGARTLKLELPHFTLIGATTRSGALSSPLRDRFGLVYYLNYYDPDEISQIVTRSALRLNIPIITEASNIIAARSRRTPRIANRLLKRVRDFAEVRNIKPIDGIAASEALKQLRIDEQGLEILDREILKILIDNFNGGPVGIATIAAATGQERETLEDVYEPYLIQIGFLQKTSRGRKVTDRAYHHFSKEIPVT